ncbi:MAG: hypothetical protein ACFFDI_25725 [Promethearchaeota archaeon]
MIRNEKLAEIQAVKIMEESCQFRVSKECITQEIYYFIEDPLEELAALRQGQLQARLDYFSQVVQLMLDNEQIEVNNCPVQRYVVDIQLKYLNSNHQLPILSISVESQHHQLLEGETNRIVLRRQEEIKTHEITESWITPGLIERAVRVNLLRPRNDPTIMETICGSRVDFDNGETRVAGGTDIIEFQYSENWGEVKEISLEKIHHGLFSRITRKK